MESGNVIVGVSGSNVGRPANHEDSLSDALEGPAADEWSFREPNHSNSVSITIYSNTNKKHFISLRAMEYYVFT